VRYYRDVLGCTVTYFSSTTATAGSRGTRILLHQVGTPATAEPHAAPVRLEVTELEAKCTAVADAGFEVIDQPATVDTGGVQAWRATVTDPDGHEVELVEWRERPATAP
jgi:predicted enzyme related to lactoylglutathione lyase